MDKEIENSIKKNGFSSKIYIHLVVHSRNSTIKREHRWDWSNPLSGSLMHYLRIGFIMVFLQNFHLADFSQHVFPLLPSLPAQQPPLSVKQCSCLDNAPSQPLKLLFDNHMSGFVSEILTNNPNRWLGRKIKFKD